MTIEKWYRLIYDIRKCKLCLYKNSSSVCIFYPSMDDDHICNGFKTIHKGENINDNR